MKSILLRSYSHLVFTASSCFPNDKRLSCSSAKYRSRLILNLGKAKSRISLTLFFEPSYESIDLSWMSSDIIEYDNRLFLSDSSSPSTCILIGFNWFLNIPPFILLDYFLCNLSLRLSEDYLLDDSLDFLMLKLLLMFNFEL